MENQWHRIISVCNMLKHNMPSQCLGLAERFYLDWLLDAVSWSLAWNSAVGASSLIQMPCHDFVAASGRNAARTCSPCYAYFHASSLYAPCV